MTTTTMTMMMMTTTTTMMTAMTSYDYIRRSSFTSRCSTTSAAWRNSSFCRTSATATITPCWSPAAVTA
eukprot:8820990-Pyramimonas_sp.AAC.1